MKKLMMFLGFLLVPIMVLCQVDSTSVDPTPPGDLWDVILHFNEWIASFSGVVILTAFLTALVNGFLKVTKNFLKQLIAWAIAIILLVATDLINIGYAKDLPLLLAVVHGFAAGLASNGVFDVPVLKAILDKVETWFKKG